MGWTAAARRPWPAPSRRHSAPIRWFTPSYSPRNRKGVAAEEEWAAMEDGAAVEWAAVWGAEWVVMAVAIPAHSRNRGRTARRFLSGFPRKPVGASSRLPKSIHWM